MKKICIALILLMTMTSISLPITGIFADKGSLGIAGVYYSGSTSYSGLYAEYNMNEMFDILGGVAFPSGTNPIFAIGSDIYVIKPTTEKLAVWIRPVYQFWNQTISGIDASITSLAISGYCGYKLTTSKLELLPYVGFSSSSSTLTLSGFGSATASTTSSIVGISVNFSPKAETKTIGDINITSSSGTSTTMVMLAFIF